MDERQRIFERERFLIEQIRELDDEELQVEEVEGLLEDSDDDAFPNSSGLATGSVGDITFDTCLASLHTYLGEVEDTHHRMASVDSGTTLILPLFHLEGVVLIPEATLPLRIIQRHFIIAIEKAMDQVDSPRIIGVVRVYRDLEDGKLRSATVGTTAEIRQHRHLEDGSINVITRGKQRFRVRRCWFDVEGTPYGEVEVIEEGLPLRTPRDAVGTLPPLRNLSSPSLFHAPESYHTKRHRNTDKDNESDVESEGSFVSELSLSEMRLHQSAMESCFGVNMIDELASSDEDNCVCASELQSEISQASDGSSSKHRRRIPTVSEMSGKDNLGQSHPLGVTWKKKTGISMLNQFRAAPQAFWPNWVYQMYDSFSLAKKAADIWKQVVGAPSMDTFTRKPDLLSFYIASKIPVSESIKQELLEINGVSYRLRREIELLQGFDRVRCKNCQTIIARRSDMLVMSEGPLGAYVNPHGIVHDILTLYKANGLALIGRPSKDYSWFPGYGWTIADCATCERHMGWLFTATSKKLKPKSFWGVRSSQVADDMR